MLNNIYLLVGTIASLVAVIMLVYTVVRDINAKKELAIKEEKLQIEKRTINEQRDLLIRRDEALMRDKRYFRINEKMESLSASSVYLDVKLKIYTSLSEKENNGEKISQDLDIMQYELHEYLMIFTNQFEAFLKEVEHFCLRYHNWIIINDVDKALVKEIRENLVNLLEFIGKIQEDLDLLYKILMNTRAPVYHLLSYQNYYSVLKKLYGQNYMRAKFHSFDKSRIKNAQKPLFNKIIS